MRWSFIFVACQLGPGTTNMFIGTTLPLINYEEEGNGMELPRVLHAALFKLMISILQEADGLIKQQLVDSGRAI
jgi:hypothetical protein